jgi:hypothetical protein
MSDLLKGAVLVVTLLAFVYSKPATCATATCGSASTPRAGAVLAARDHDHDLGQRLPDHVPRAGAAGPVPVRAGGLRSRLPDGLRGGDEVLRARRLGSGHAALRHLDALRCHRRSGIRGRCRGDGQRRASRTRCWCSGWSSSSSASRSSSAPCPSTCGCRMSIRARRRRWCCSCPARPRSRPSPWRRASWSTALGAAGDWSEILIILSVLSMGIGNVVAIAQTNIKRMLAYSTISHVGFIFLGLLAGTQPRLRRGDVLRGGLCADGGRCLRRAGDDLAQGLRGKEPRRPQGSRRS